MAPAQAWGANPIPQPKKGMSSGKVAVLVVGIVVFGIVALVIFSMVFASWSTSVIDDNVPLNAEIGSCYGRFDDRLPVSCESLHHYEVFSLIEYPSDATYPGRLERLTGADICEQDFESYTGQSYWTSPLDYSIPLPTEDAWAAGVRTTVCVLHDADHQPISGSRRQ
jgi:hypothetical protein